MKDTATKQEQVTQVMRLRWPIWGTMCLVMLFVLFHRVSPAAVADRLMADFAISGAAFGGLAAVYFYVYAAMQVPSGVLADSLGPRKTVAVGGLVAGVGSLLFGLAPTLEMGYVGRFLVGLGVSVNFVCMMKLQGEWFRGREFATMSGLLMLVANTGAILGATPLALMATAIGWRLSFQLMGLFSLIGAAACWWVVRDRPSDLGLPTMRDIEAAEHGANPGSAVAPVRQVPLARGLYIAFRNPYTWPPFLAGLGLYGTFVTFTSAWGIPYLMQVYGLSRSGAANYMVVATLGLMLGGPLVGYLSDSVFRRRKLPFVAFSIAYLGAWAPLILWGGGRPPLGLLFPLSFFLGLSASGMALSIACVREANHPAVAGMATGIANVGGFLGGAVLQPLVGYALDLGWQGDIVEGARVYPAEAFQIAFVIMVAAAALGVLGTLLIRETHCQNVALQKEL